MQHKIYNESMETHFIIDDSSSLSDMQSKCPKFFDSKHGSRETFTVYRGQLIARATDRHASAGPIRRTSVFLFLVGSDDKTDTKTVYPYHSCVSSGCDVDSVRQAKRLIDRIIDGGKYAYGMSY